MHGPSPPQSQALKSRRHYGLAGRSPSTARRGRCEPAPLLLRSTKRRTSRKMASDQQDRGGSLDAGLSLCLPFRHPCMRLIRLTLVLCVEFFVPCAKAQQPADVIVTAAKLQQRVNSVLALMSYSVVTDLVSSSLVDFQRADRHSRARPRRKRPGYCQSPCRAKLRAPNSISSTGAVSTPRPRRLVDAGLQALSARERN